MEDKFPRNGDAREANEKTREIMKPEKFQRRDIINCVSKLTTLRRIIESGQLVEFRRKMLGGVSVSLFFVMIGELSEVMNC